MLSRFILVNDQREHPSSSPPLKYVSQSVPVCLNLCNGCNGCILVNDGCNGRGHRGVRPGLSTYVTDVTDVDILVNDQRFW